MSVSPATTVILREGVFAAVLPPLNDAAPQQRASNPICQAHQGNSRDAPQRGRSSLWPFSHGRTRSRPGRWVPRWFISGEILGSARP